MLDLISKKTFLEKAPTAFDTHNHIHWHDGLGSRLGSMGEGHVLQSRFVAADIFKVAQIDTCALAVVVEKHFYRLPGSSGRTVLGQYEAIKKS